MRKVLVLFVSILAVASVVVRAEEIPLQPIVRPVGIAGEKLCLPFFATTILNGAERVIFWYKTPDGKMERSTVKKEQVKVQVVDESKVPTYEYEVVNEQDGARIRLNKVEYNKAQVCLPASEAVKTTQ